MVRKLKINKENNCNYMIKNYKQYINEDLRSKNIHTEVVCNNLKFIYTDIQVRYNNEYKIVISYDKTLFLNELFYDTLKKDNIDNGDIVFENCEKIELDMMSGFTKIPDYGAFGAGIKDFKCGYCGNLTSLQGSPETINGDFNCSFCENLTSLEGAPETVGYDFQCGHCYNLISLTGAPKKVGGYFKCHQCNPGFIKLAIEKYGKKVIYNINN